MKKLLTYSLGIFACAWLINGAISLLVEVWGILFWIGILVFSGWFIFRIINHKKWR